MKIVDRTKQIALDLLQACSLANLCLLPEWSEYLYSPVKIPSYFETGLGPAAEANILISLILTTLAFGLLLFCGIRLYRAFPRFPVKQLAYGVYLILLLIVVNNIRLMFGWSKLKLTETMGAGILIGLAFLGIAFCIFIQKHYASFLKISRSILCCFSVFIVVTFSQSLFSLTKLKNSREFSANAPRYASMGQNSPRIFWIIFDELDIRVAFEKRPKSVDLPELDRFRNQSLYAQNAYAAGPATSISIPAMITGQYIDSVNPLSAHQLELTLRNSEKVLWNEQPSIFDKASRMGYNCGVVGNHHPYSRVLGKDLAFCLPSYCDIKRNHYSIWDWSSIFIKTIFLKHMPLLHSSEIDRDLFESFINQHHDLIENIETLAADPSYGLLFLHASIPHLPGIYDREKNAFAVNKETDYLGNLVLTDITLGRLRSVMEKAGLWDETTIIVTSDHWLRKFWKLTSEEFDRIKEDDPRVPFMIKMAHQQSGLIFDAPFNTIAIHNLIEAILKEELKTPEETALWLEKQPFKLSYFEK